MINALGVVGHVFVKPVLNALGVSVMVLLNKNPLIGGLRFPAAGFHAHQAQLNTHKKKANDGGRFHPRLSVWAARRGAAQAGFATFAPAGWFVGFIGHAWAAGDVVKQGTHCSPLAVKLFSALKCFSAASLVR